MNWDVIGVIAEVISAAAVVVSLIYLAMQIRHTRRQTDAENVQTAVERWVEAQNKAMRSEEDADFLRTALHGYDSLNAPQKAKFSTFLLDLCVPFAAMHAKQESGLLDTRIWEAVRTDMAAWLKCDGLAKLWAEVKATYPQYLADEIDAAVAAYQGPPCTEALPFLRLDKPSASV